MNTTKESGLAKLAESSCDYFVSKGKCSHKYAGNGLRENKRDVTQELELYLNKYSSYVSKSK